MQGTRWALVLLQAYRLTLPEGATASPLTADDGTIPTIDDRFEQVHDLNKSIKAIEDDAKLSQDKEINVHSLSRFSEELQETLENKRENKTINYLDRLINKVKSRLIGQGNFPNKNYVNIAKIDGRRKINRPNKDAKSSKDSKSGEDSKPSKYSNSSEDAKLTEDARTSEGAKLSKDAKPSEDTKPIDYKPSKDAKSSKDAEPSQKAKPNKSKFSRKQLKKRRNSLNYEEVDPLISKRKDKQACFYKKKQGHGKGPEDHPICCNCCQYSVLGCS